MCRQVSGLTSKEIEALVVGPPGSSVVLEVEKDADSKRHSVCIPRMLGSTPLKPRSSFLAPEPLLPHAPDHPASPTDPTCPLPEADLKEEHPAPIRRGSFSPPDVQPYHAAPHQPTAITSGNLTANTSLTPGSASHLAKSGAPHILPAVFGGQMPHAPSFPVQPQAPQQHHEHEQPPPAVANKPSFDLIRLDAFEKAQSGILKAQAEILKRLEAAEKVNTRLTDAINEQNKALGLMREGMEQRCSCVVS